MKNKIKMKNDVYRHYIEKKKKKKHMVNPNVCPLQTISMFSTILHIQQKQPH